MSLKYYNSCNGFIYKPAKEDLSLTPSNVAVARVALLADEWMAECWCWLTWCRYVNVALTQALAAPQSGTQTAHHPWLLLEVEMSRNSHVHCGPEVTHRQCVLLDKYRFDALGLAYIIITVIPCQQRHNGEFFYFIHLFFFFVNIHLGTLIAICL